MQLNSIVFAAPKCSYSTSSLLKDLIYIPRCPSRWVPKPAEINSIDLQNISENGGGGG